MIEPSSQRLVQPWEANEVNRLFSSKNQRRRNATNTTVCGVIGLLILAIFAQALTPHSAAMAVAAAAWGFLTVVHLGQGSPKPRWSSLAPAVPLAILIGSAALSGGLQQMDSYVLVKKLGALAGLAAFGAAAHISMQRPHVCRRILWGAAVLGAFFVGMASVTRIFTQSPPATSSPTLPVILEILSGQSDLIAVSLMCLSIGLGMTLEALQRGHCPSGGTAIAFLPLTLPLAASSYGSSIAGVLFALAVFLIVTHCRPTGLSRSHHIAIYTGTALSGLCFTQAWLSQTSSGAGAANLQHLWQVVRLRPPFGHTDSAGLVPASDLMRLLFDYGYVGLFLIALSLTLFAYHRFRANSSHTLLSWWCWIAAAVVSGMALYHAPLEHPAVALMGILLLVCACGNLDLPQRPSSRKALLMMEEESPPASGTHERARSPSGNQHTVPSEIPPPSPPLSAFGSDAGRSGEPGTPVDPQVRIMRRRRT